MATLAILEVQSPQRLKMSHKEYLEFTTDSQIIEWVDGEVICYIPPVYSHQRLVIFLATVIGSCVEYFQLGDLISSPFEVKLWPDGPSREPDIFFIAAANLDKLTPQRFEGGPDLVIEIDSPGSVTEDRVR